MKKSNQEGSRQHNSRLVLSTIYNIGEISRVDISRSTGLTRTTVSEIVTEFMADGLVVESGFSPSTGGKPAILLRVEENAQLLVGVDLAETEFRGALVNLRGEVVHRVEVRVGARDGDAALELVYWLIGDLLRNSGKKIIGIGVGTPGLMEPTTGKVRQAINLNWQDLPLGELLSQRFDLPVHIANDCQVAALGEHTFGVAKGSDHLILIKAGRGIGAGIIIGGRIFYGDNAGAGEIGHVQVVENGDPCRCGNHGCLETILSDHALVRQARQIAEDQPDTILNQMVPHPKDILFETLVRAYRNNDFWVVEMVNEAAHILGKVIAHLVGALNVNQILIAGNFSSFGDELIRPLRQPVQNGTLPGLGCQTDIGFSSLADDIVIQGAASLVLKNELGLF
jgi:glucokinase-like ROK family protein